MKQVSVLFSTKYSRMDQAKFVEDNLWEFYLVQSWIFRLIYNEKANL